MIEINEINALSEFRTGWRGLLRRTPGATFFQSLEWLEIYWQHYGAAQRLRVLLVRVADRLAGIVPLVVKRQPTKAGSLRVLTYPLHDWGSFYGPIGPEPLATLHAALGHVLGNSPDWDTIDLRWVHPEISLLPAEIAMTRAGAAPYRTVWTHTAAIDLSGDWESYLAGRPSKWRNCFRRWERRLKARGSVEYVRYRPHGGSGGAGDPRWDLYDACERVASRSWQGDSSTGTTLSHPSVRPFLREVHAAAAEAGAVDMNLLYVQGEPTAFVYNYCHDGSVYGLRMGYDAAGSRHGAGSLICAYSIRDSFERGDRFYDMGAGYLDSKRHLATAVLPVYRLSHFRLTAPKAQLVRLKRWMEHRKLLKEQKAGSRLPRRAVASPAATKFAQMTGFPAQRRAGA